MSTFMHLIARAPYRCGRPFNDVWSFHDKDGGHSGAGAVDPSDVLAAQMKDEYNEEMRKKYRQRVNEREMLGRRLSRRNPPTTTSASEEEAQHLLSHHDDPVVNSTASIPQLPCQIDDSMSEIV